MPETVSTTLNTSSSTLYRWLREEKVPAHKLGRQWRFLREELERWREEVDRWRRARDWAPEPLESLEQWRAKELACWQRYAEGILSRVF